MDMDSEVGPDKFKPRIQDYKTMSFFRKTRPEPPITDDDLLDIRKAIDKAKLPEDVDVIVRKELERLEKTDPSTAEYSIALNYIEYLISLPWNHFTEDNLDFNRVEEILEKTHYGLTHVKERVLEYLAVRTLCQLKSFRILVVDDEDIARTNLEYVLKKDGYEVDTAVNGIEALERVKLNEYDLILTDLKMEKLDGLQLLEEAKKIAPHSEIIMITGYATVTSAVDAMQKGAAHYMAKPIDLKQLRQTIKSIKKKKRHLQMARGPILCFSGPPGTGKTSIGRAIAEALERKFVRLSLAGLRDESELRGHRRTYAGAMPGRIIHEIRRLGVKNPVFMLDEIDKIGQDFRGDAASVLLEILDPEQNSHFVDYYLDIPFNLSGVMFIATANIVDRLPAPLLDRLEVIDFPGYTETEKTNIAKYYLIPRQLRDHGLSHIAPQFTDEAVVKIIREYTQEAGLRNLERQIATVCRKLARLCLSEDRSECPRRVDESVVERLLGPRKYEYEVAAAKNRIGVTTGLVWTEFGGEIIFVEASKMRGNQKLILTGSLGNIIRESAQTALSYIRSNASRFQIDPDFFRDTDIHIHIPSGAIPKDGPSAGITIAFALLSLLTKRPARRNVALTGELTLSGRILPVGGIREKVLAAKRAGVSQIVFPLRNQVDVKQLEKDVVQGLEVFFAREIPDVLDIVLMPPD